MEEKTENVNEWEGFFKELSYSLIYVGNEMLYVFSMIVEMSWKDALKIIIEIVSMPTEVARELLGTVLPDAAFDLDDITEEDIACRRYGRNMVRVPK